MAIEVLGKSLLSAARKKNKKRQRIGNMAALAYVGMSAANSLIRKKAIKRAKEFENGLLPLETALNGEYLRIEKAKTKYNDIMKQKGETGTVREVFSNAEKARLQKLVNASATTAKYNDEELNQLAFNDSQDEYDAWVNDTETYKPFFDVTKDDYFKNFETLKTEGKKDIEDDSLSRRFNKKFGLGDEEKMIEARIAFDNASKEELVLSLPERLHKQLDIPFLQQLNKIKIREMDYNSVETSTKLYNEDGEIEILMNRILVPKETEPAKESKIEPRITTAWNTITDGNKITNDFYMGDITFATTDPEGNNVTSVMTIESLRKSLKTTKKGQPIDKTDLNITNDWDSITQGALQQAQLLYLNQVKDFPGVVITEPMFREFVANGLRQSIAANVVLSPKVKGERMFGGGGTPETAQLKVVDTPPPPSKETLAETFIKTVEASGEDIESDNIQKQLLKLITQNPETKDELTPFIINKEISTPTVEEEPIVETTTPKSLLDPEETVETKTSSSLLSQDKVYRKYTEIMADDSLTDIQKEDELSERVRDEFRQSIKNIPTKMRLRSFNQTKKRANKFLEGKTSGFYSTEFTKWKKENDIVTNYKTPKDEYKKYVEEFLEDLENQIDSV